MDLLTQPVGLSHYLVVGAVLFVCGVVCMATKRNALGVLMGIELVLNGANLNFVAFGSPLLRADGRYAHRARRAVDRPVRDRAGGGRSGRGAGHRAELLQQSRDDRRRPGRRVERLMELATSTADSCLGLAWLLPLASFALIVLFGPRMGQRRTRRGLPGHGWRSCSASSCSLVALAHGWSSIRWAATGTVRLVRRPRWRRCSPPGRAGTWALSRLVRRPLSRQPRLPATGITLGQFGTLRADDRLLHRRPDRGHVLHGHADRLVHPRLLLRLHARRAARGDRPDGHARRRPAAAPPRPVPPLLPVPVAVLLQHAGAGDRRQHGDGVRLLGTGGHLLLLPDRLLHRAARAPRTRPTRRSSSTASATSA